MEQWDEQLVVQAGACSFWASLAIWGQWLPCGRWALMDGKQHQDQVLPADPIPLGLVKAAQSCL